MRSCTASGVGHALPWRSDADPSWLDGDQSTADELVAMSGEDLQDRFALAPRGEVHHADNAGMVYAADDDKLAKVFVERDKDPAVGVCTRKDFLVARIAFPVSSPDNIMTSVTQRYRRAAPDTSIEEQLHASESTTKGSTRSWPTRRRA